MADSSSPTILPTTKLPQRTMKRSIFSSSPTFRTRPPLAFTYVFIFFFFGCTIFFISNNSSINHSFKNILRNRSHFSSLSHYFFFHENTLENPDIQPIALSTKENGSDHITHNGSRNETLMKSGQELVSEVDDHGVKKAGEENVRLNGTDLFMRVKDKDDDFKSTVEMNETWVEMISKCDIFDGKWVREDLNPFYEPGTCPHIDEPFNCYLNGRPDNGYEKFTWQPYHCSIPRQEDKYRQSLILDKFEHSYMNLFHFVRLNGRNMLELLRGKRLVYVGDSLNRNMWESMVCLLWSSVEDKSKVFEASGKYEFKKEGAYSFVFSDYNCSVEFMRSPFLVQEWEMPDNNGTKKETLRLDLVERSCDKYKDADVLVFNTGHWWTHERTSEGKGYYQEGSHVYGKMNVTEAFRKAMTTWARWIESNINPMKTHVFFRGYSVSHFSGGEWYSGGKCDSDEEPITNEEELSPVFPPIPDMLEEVLKGMKQPVFYLNITRMTDFRRDAHPSVYRQPNMTEEEKQEFIRHQDCSHWCLPGVPDTWNEIMFSQLLLRQKQKQLQ
ncbi:Protein trichome birefringence [Abeliophyllum distichum]|uniref:Protein trichome birefringence n=1 Tax=Abeliophyllum distichum TaxID=126358 RepID=A0ABD1VU90_9LAMI